MRVSKLRTAKARLLWQGRQIRKELGISEPERAARFAVLSATSSIELASLGEISLWRVALRVSDKALAAELARQMLAYLTTSAR